MIRYQFTNNTSSIQSVNQGKLASRSGFTLVELLVTIVIIAIGLLGLAALQITGLKESQASSSRLLANQLVYDMADRIAANRLGAAIAANYTIAHGTAAATAPDCVNNACTAAQIASYDLAKWKTSTASLLSGDGEISFSAPNYTIIVRWDESNSGVTGTTCPPVADTDLNCVTLSVWQ